MPRFLSHALDTLQELPPPPADAYPFWEPLPQELWDYLRTTSRWHLAGLRAKDDAADQAARLYKANPTLRIFLEPLIFWHPHEAFVHLYAKRVLKGRRRGPLRHWRTVWQTLDNDVTPTTIRRARHWRSGFDSVYACLTWARELDGGDEAWRQLAETFRQDEAFHRRSGESRGEHFMRHDLETHGTITPWEGSQINRFLDRYHIQPLSVIGGQHWWMSPSPRFVDTIHDRKAALQAALTTSKAFAGAQWSAHDDALYDAALQRLEQDPVTTS